MLKSRLLKLNSSAEARTLGQTFLAISFLFGSIGVGSIAYAYFFSVYSDYFPIVELILIGIPLLLVLLAAFLSFEAVEVCRQRMLDLEAQEILSAIEATQVPIPKYVLYLRPFDSTGRVLQDVHYESTDSRGEKRVRHKRFELEAQFAEAARRTCAFIGLGQSLEHVGAGRIEVDDQSWKEAIRKLMQNARLIVMVPVTNPGTLWELDQIIENSWLSKTLLLNIPEEERIWDKPRFQQSDDWPLIQQRLANAGFSLPSFSKSGRIIFFRSSGRPPMVRRLKIEDQGNLYRTLRATKRLNRP